MRVSPAVRSLRAAVFAALCVLLAAGGHAMATGMAPPVRIQAAGALVLFAAGCLLGGRERSLTGIGGGTLASQAGLHLAFATARPQTVMVMHGLRMSHSAGHPHTPHATAAHLGAALLLTWWLRRGEAALWSLLRWAAALLPGLVAWWRVARGTRTVPAVPRPGRSAAGAAGAPRQALLRYAVHRRGPPAWCSYAIR
ncbi:hypothetical protein [Streptomyces sp. DSM 15324]|uniref:hypothetical protein n=1 Tax=Streptomyces sp. DSM 15324 TaxID=1739111 RepID=UPI00074A4E38|nr:hypothetical protein [Streptomyces sp. DSM 15324]KUO12825.1 hypothetical protein AQJ58_07755 [Streptomyces sp. DSM 15324]